MSQVLTVWFGPTWCTSYLMHFHSGHSHTFSQINMLFYGLFSRTCQQAGIISKFWNLLNQKQQWRISAMPYLLNFQCTNSYPCFSYTVNRPNMTYYTNIMITTWTKWHNHATRWLPVPKMSDSGHFTDQRLKAISRQYVNGKWLNTQHLNDATDGPIH